MKDNNSKQVLLSVLGVAILVVAVVGVSFAAFSYSQTGSNVNQITTGTISMSYDQSEPTINISNALPMSDAEGIAQTGEGNVFNFSVSATIAGDATINYAVTASEANVKGLTASDVKVYLTDGVGDTGSDETGVGETASAPVLVSALPLANSDGTDTNTGAPGTDYVLDSGTFSGTGGTNNYRLRMWLAETEEAVAGDQTYGLRVNVYGKADAQ